MEKKQIGNAYESVLFCVPFFLFGTKSFQPLRFGRKKWVSAAQSHIEIVYAQRWALNARVLKSSKINIGIVFPFIELIAGNCFSDSSILTCVSCVRCTNLLLLADLHSRNLTANVPILYLMNPNNEWKYWTMAKRQGSSKYFNVHFIELKP